MTTNERRRELADSSLILSQTGTQEGVPHADLTEAGDPSLCCQTTY